MQDPPNDSLAEGENNWRDIQETIGHYKCEFAALRKKTPKKKIDMYIVTVVPCYFGHRRKATQPI